MSDQIDQYSFVQRISQAQKELLANQKTVLPQVLLTPPDFKGNKNGLTGKTKNKKVFHKAQLKKDVLSQNLKNMQGTNYSSLYSNNGKAKRKFKD